MRHIILLSVFLLSACGGRVTNMVEEMTEVDPRLTCSHLKAEFEVNLEKIKDITKEKGAQIENNFALLIASPLFLDFNGTERKEIQALQKRNLHLIELMQNKSCAPINQEAHSGDPKNGS